VAWRILVVVAMGLVYLLQLKLSMGNMHVDQPRRLVLVVVGRRHVGPLVSLAGLAIVDENDLKHPAESHRVPQPSALASWTGPRPARNVKRTINP
jgi:hypothetical protein